MMGSWLTNYHKMISILEASQGDVIVYSLLCNLLSKPLCRTGPQSMDGIQSLWHPKSISDRNKNMEDMVFFIGIVIGHCNVRSVGNVEMRTRPGSFMPPFSMSAIRPRILAECTISYLEALLSQGLRIMLDFSKGHKLLRSITLQT